MFMLTHIDIHIDIPYVMNRSNDKSYLLEEELCPNHRVSVYFTIFLKIPGSHDP